MKKASGLGVRIFISCGLCLLLLSMITLSEAKAETYISPPDKCQAALQGNSLTWPAGSIQVNWENHSAGDYQTVLARKDALSSYVEIEVLPHGTSFYKDAFTYNKYLEPYTTYCYKVAAKKAGPVQQTAWSNEACLDTPTLPPHPANLKATTVSDPSPRVILSWGVIPGAAGYRIEREDGNGKYKELNTVTQGVNTYSDTGTENTEYRYRVITCAFFRSEPAEVAIKTGARIPEPPMPTNLKAKAAINSIGLSWDNPVAYDELVLLRRKEGEGIRDSIKMPAPDETSYSDTGLIPETAYNYRIFGIKKYPNGQRWSAETAEVKAVYPQPTSMEQHQYTPLPVAPQIVDLKPGTNSIIVSWKIPQTVGGAKGIKTFKIERKQLQRNTVFAQIAEVPANTGTLMSNQTFPDKALTPETTYIYRIRSHYDQGDSPYSAEAKAKTLPTIMKKETNGVVLPSMQTIPGKTMSR
jgi:hypothetical protein